MNLTENQAWPPIPGEVTHSIAEWDAWYSGSALALSRAYEATPVRPSQYAGGFLGGMSRMLWGSPPRSSADHRIHLPLASDIAAASSALLFGEELQLDTGTNNIAFADELNRMLDKIGWQSYLAEAGEMCSALGGVYLRAGWDTDVADQPLASLVAPDGAVPTFSFGILKEVTFWYSEDENGTVWRHTETHRPGQIQHQLWKGSSTSLGKLVPLTERQSTAALVDSLDGEDFISTGTNLLTAVYVPNLRPVPQWRRVPGATYLGRSDFGVNGVPGLFDALDETWSSWMRDIRHGRSRIMASSTVLKNDGPGQGAYLDLDREVYEEFRVPVGEDPSIDKLIKAQQFNIRVEEHSRTIRELTLSAVNACGYSGSTFGLDTEVAKTATEVGAVRGRTRDTREKKTRYWTPALEQFLTVLTELNRSIFNRPGLSDALNVSFPAFSSPSLLELAQTAQALQAAQAASKKTLVQLVHPDWEEGQVQEEVDLILGETAPAPINVANPFAPDTGAPTEPTAPEPPA